MPFIAKKISLAFLSFLLLHPLFGQSQSADRRDDSRSTIEVIGLAEQEIIPDEIFISVSIKERYEGRNKITVETQEEKLKKLFQEAGLNLENLSLSDADASFVRVKLMSKDVITQKNYLLKVASAEEITKAFLAMEKAEIKGAYIAGVNHSKLEELNKETRILAIKAAKAKSDYLLEAIGQKTGRALTVFETRPGEMPNIASGLNVKGNRESGAQYYINGVKVIGSSVAQDAQPVLQFQKIRIEFAVYAKFEIQ